MNSQLEQLQSSIDTLTERYLAAVEEKKALAKQVAQLQEAQKNQAQIHEAALTELNLSYSDRISKLEKELRQDIQVLQSENAQYLSLLTQSASEIRNLLARLPVLPSNKSEEAA